MSIKDLKKQYSDLLLRHNRATSFLDDPAIPLEEREQQVPVFRELIREMESLLNSLKALGYKVSEAEINHGFKAGR